MSLFNFSMNLSPEHFVRTRKLIVDGVVRGTQEEPIKIELTDILTAHVPCFRLKLFKAVTETVAEAPVHPLDGPLLSLTGWPRAFTPNFTPQAYLSGKRRSIEQRDHLGWLVALIDPDSRLFLRAPGEAEVHRTFQTEDFPRLSAVYRCSILLSGGAQTRATRLNDFVEALLRGQLPDLPDDWHFMPTLP